MLKSCQSSSSEKIPFLKEEKRKKKKVMFGVNIGVRAMRKSMTATKKKNTNDVE